MPPITFYIMYNISYKYIVQYCTNYQKQSTFYHIFKMIKNYQFLSTIISVHYIVTREKIKMFRLLKFYRLLPSLRYLLPPHAISRRSLFTLPKIWYLSRNRCQNYFILIRSTMSVSTQKCIPGDRGKQIQVSQSGSTYNHEIIIYQNNNTNNN